MQAQPIKFWDRHSDWKEAESAWDRQAARLASAHPLKSLKKLPDLPGIRPGTRRHLRWKALKYLVAHDEKRIFPRFFFQRPFFYAASLLRSYLRKKAYVRDGDFFLYGMAGVDEFRKLLAVKGSILAVGFSYCHKPFECPSGRFTEQCIHDPEHPVCGQCFIGKCVNALPPGRVVPLLIPTVHYIGEQMGDLVHRHPGREVLFIITACELTLEMFADWGNMLHIKGIGVRLDGLICNTMKAFVASEIGIKPGLTVVLDETQKRILDLLAFRRSLEAPAPGPRA